MIHSFVLTVYRMMMIHSFVLTVYRMIKEDALIAGYNELGSQWTKIVANYECLSGRGRQHAGVKLVHLCNVKDPRLKPYANKNDPRLLSPAAKQWANEVRHSTRSRANLQGHQIINIHPYDSPSVRHSSLRSHAKFRTRRFIEWREHFLICFFFCFLQYVLVMSRLITYVHVPFTYFTGQRASDK
jgi:hypothetical protein